VEHNVSRRLQVVVTDGATATFRVQDTFPKQVRSALDAALHQQPSEEFDTERGGVVPNKVSVLVADAAVGADLV
jgi:hypothetical protein